jgi:hypothetical protein
VWTVATSPPIALAGVWAAAALLLPVLVRGRALAVDAVGAVAWAAGLAAGTQAATGAPAGRLIAGAVAGGALALLIRASRGGPDTR